MEASVSVRKDMRGLMDLPRTGTGDPASFEHVAHGICWSRTSSDRWPIGPWVAPGHCTQLVPIL